MPPYGINFRELEPVIWLWKAGKERTYFMCVFQKHLLFKITSHQ